MSPVAAEYSGGCGKVVIQAANAGCYPSVIKDTFMVQYCCGAENCRAAGVRRKRSLDGRSERWTIVSLTFIDISNHSGASKINPFARYLKEQNCWEHST
jgi:hypothetical protein